LLPNAGLDGDTGAAFAVSVSDGIAISEISARAAMNFLMTHLLAGNIVLFLQRHGSPCLAVGAEIGLWE
jgi:hypothetical protein